MPSRMLSSPTLGPITRCSTMMIGAASAPARSSFASSVPSAADRPVIWKLFENTPRIVATLMTSSFERSTATSRPSRSTSSRSFSMNTTAIGRFRFSRVARSISSPPRLSRRTETAGSPCEGAKEASMSCSPVAITSRFSSTGVPSRCR